MKARSHQLIHVLLVACCLALAGVTWRARTQTQRAEWYAQSGIDSVTSICSAVLFELRQGGSGRPMFHIAEECIGDVDSVDRERLSRQVADRDAAAIAARIEQRLKERALPYLTLDPVKTEFLPKGYRD